MIWNSSRNRSTHWPNASAWSSSPCRRRAWPRPFSLTYFYRTEREIASRLQGLLDHVSRIAPEKISRAVEHEEQRQSLTLSEEQRAAVESACGHKVSIITGGPGTGKTTITRVVVRALKALGLKISLAAPTGRAAKRLAEATGFTATTLHRLLRYQPATGFEFNEEKKLSADVMVVDEVSMLDCGLCLSLLRALPLTCRLVFCRRRESAAVGGRGQCARRHDRERRDSGRASDAHLPPGAGEHDRGQRAPASTKASFPWVAHMPRPRPIFSWVEKESLLELQALVLRMVCERIPEAYGLDPMTDVQVLTPMHKGEVGTIALNRLLQERLNPQGRELLRGQRAYRVGDRILQLQEQLRQGSLQRRPGAHTRLRSGGRDPGRGIRRPGGGVWFR